MISTIRRYLQTDEFAGRATTEMDQAYAAQLGSYHMDVADYYGIATGNKMPDKFAKSGYHAEKSAFVNAPIITEFPVAMECELAEITETENLHAVVGRIVNVSVDEKVLGEKDKIDPMKLNALIFDQFQSGYYVATEKVGQAWNAGKEMMKAAQGK